MKNLFTAIVLFISLSAHGQIVLDGYRCKYYQGQWPYSMGEMYKGADTFLFDFLGRDMLVEESGVEENARRLYGDIVKFNEEKLYLHIGLELAFGDEHYIRTKDSLYIYTGQNSNGVYYYEVYVHSKFAALSIRKAKNDADFSYQSKWLLSQIRQKLKEAKDVFFLNENGETCQYPPDEYR